MIGRLYVVATPIGNLADITLRALDVLRAVPLIAAEDTRLAKRLLARYDISTRTISYHARSGPGRTAELLAHLRHGADLALVTDAGTPGVSDPGGALVAAWAAEGGSVVPIPGASAALAALAAAGVAGPRWTFEGFLPRSGRIRRERLAATVADLAATCGPDRAGAVARELTKLHEQVARGSLGELARLAAEGGIPARGEAVIVVGWAGEPSPATALRIASAAPSTEAAARASVEELVREGTGRAAAARQVARATGISRRRLYGAAATRIEP